MAGLPIQIGDMVALATLARTVIEYGWGQNSNAAKQHDQFYRDVEDLYRGLLALDQIINDADRELEQQLGIHTRNARLRVDWRSLGQIIGDCRLTLNDCKDLLSRNKKFASSSGPVQNIKWNLFVQSDVNALRKRVRQHFQKISLAEDVLKLDLLSRIREDIRRMHWDLADRIQDVQVEIRTLQQYVRKIPGVTTPESLGETFQQDLTFTESSPSLTLSPTAEQFFDSAYLGIDAPSGTPSLSDSSDAFLYSFYESTYRFRPGLDLHREPPNDQYINLLKCTWLLQKIRSSEELSNAVPDSHWPSYINELEKQLSIQWARFSGQNRDSLEQPQNPAFTEINTRIWPQKEPKSNAPLQVEEEEDLEEILRTQVIHGSEDSVPVGLSVFRSVRQEDMSPKPTDEFRICFSLGVDGVPSLAGDLRALDFSLRMATIRPTYAVDPNPPFGRSIIVETGPTTIARTSTRLEFHKLKEMMKFQHAMTGYKVFANKVFYASVKFIYKNGPKGNKVPSQDACLQLWIPRRKEAGTDQNTASGPSSPSDSAVSMTFRRPLSMSGFRQPGAPSIAETVQSVTSVRTTRTVVIPMNGRAPGILHVSPDKPILVLFTHDPATGEKLMVTMDVDGLDVNPKRCDCDRNDIRSKQCPNVAIERDVKQGEPLLGVRRFEAIVKDQKDWNVSRLAFEQRGEPDEGRKPWTDLTRLTIKFHNADDRRTFSGERCACKNRGKRETRTELLNCVNQGHRGLLGEVKTSYRLDLLDYDEWRGHRQHVIRTDSRNSYLGGG